MIEKNNADVRDTRRSSGSQNAKEAIDIGSAGKHPTEAAAGRESKRMEHWNYRIGVRDPASDVDWEDAEREHDLVISRDLLNDALGADDLVYDTYVVKSIHSTGARAHQWDFIAVKKN